MNPGLLNTLIVAPIVVFLLYRRARRTFGRQPFREGALIARSAILTLFGVVSVAFLHTPPALSAAAAGAAIGIGLALYGLRLTRFEVDQGKRFYTPSGWIGLIVTALFLGRFASRMLTIYQVAKETGVPPQDAVQRSPLTLGIFLLLAGYYVTYSLGVRNKLKSMPVDPTPRNPILDTMPLSPSAKTEAALADVRPPND